MIIANWRRLFGRISAEETFAVEIVSLYVNPGGCSTPLLATYYEGNAQ